MTLPKILDGTPEGVKHDRLIPWSAALRVVVPLIEINDPTKGATAIPAKAIFLFTFTRIAVSAAGQGFVLQVRSRQ